MSHEEAREQLEAWIDGELEAAASADVASHVEVCADCAAEASDLRRLGTALFSAPEPRGREAFVARVMAAARGEAAPAPWSARWLAPALGLALAGLLAGLALPGGDLDDSLDGGLAADAYAVVELP